jgi:hypothetical protein
MNVSTSKGLQKYKATSFRFGFVSFQQFRYALVIAIWLNGGWQHLFPVDSLRMRKMRRHENTARRLSSRSWSERSFFNGRKKGASWQQWRSSGSCRRRMWIFKQEVIISVMSCWH